MTGDIMKALDAVRNLETELTRKRKEVSVSLRASREALGLTLIEVGRRVRLSPSAVHNIERSKAWKTRTVEKIARFYDRAA